VPSVTDNVHTDAIVIKIVRLSFFRTNHQFNVTDDDVHCAVFGRSGYWWVILMFVL